MRAAGKNSQKYDGSTPSPSRLGEKMPAAHRAPTVRERSYKRTAITHEEILTLPPLANPKRRVTPLRLKGGSLMLRVTLATAHGQTATRRASDLLHGKNGLCGKNDTAVGAFLDYCRYLAAFDAKKHQQLQSLLGLAINLQAT